MSKLVIRRIDVSTEDPSDLQIRELNFTDPPPADFVNDLNGVQREAVVATDGPVLVVAGAGSGKTRVLTYRIAYLLSQGIKPWHILALTFTNKAASEMKERIGHLVGDSRARPLWMGTFHSVFSRILRVEAEHIGFTKNFSIYDTDDSLGIVRAAMQQFGIPTQDYSPKMIHSRISSAKNALVMPAEYRDTARTHVEKTVANVYERYQQQLRANNAMDFDDLLVRTIELFAKHSDVLTKYQEQFSHIVIDEYQDTNRAQYTVVAMLASKRRNLCVVGDDAQSIYKFRGADIRNILDFERDYPDYKIFRLEQNYRSTQTILAAADDVIRNNRGQIPKTLWTANPEGSKIEVFTARDERDEGEYVVRSIRRAIDLGTSVNEIAVLYRTNSQSLSIEEAMRRARIPYAIVGGLAFYQRKEIKDALAYLRLVVNERDDESFMRAVNVPARGIGQTTLKRLRDYASMHSAPLLQIASNPDDVPELNARAGNALAKFATMIGNYRTSPEQIIELPLAEVARGLLSESGLLQSYRDEGTPEALARWDNVQRLLSSIAEYSDENEGATLDEYLQHAALASELDNYDNRSERVTMMTIHSAKGLEFETVVVTGMEEGLFPVGASAQQQEDLEEERRLFYVAVTRAKKQLHLSNAERRYRFGELSYPSPSRFLNEIRSEILEYKSVVPQATQPRNVFGWDNQQRRSAPQQKQREFNDFDDISGSDDDYSQVAKPLQAGSTVMHPTFGRGRVETIIGSGQNAKVTVRFDTVGRKQLMLKFANLKIV